MREYQLRDLKESLDTCLSAHDDCNMGKVSRLRQWEGVERWRGGEGRWLGPSLDLAGSACCHLNKVC